MADKGDRCGTVSGTDERGCAEKTMWDTRMRRCVDKRMNEQDDGQTERKATRHSKAIAERGVACNKTPHHTHTHTPHTPHTTYHVSSFVAGADMPFKKKNL